MSIKPFKMKVAGISLVEVLLVISLLSVFAGFGVNEMLDYQRQQEFNYVVERARILAQEIQNNRKIEKLGYDLFAGEMTLRGFVQAVGEDKIRTYMPSLLESDQLTDGPLADFYRLNFTSVSVQVSWNITDTRYFDFVVPYAENKIEVIEPAGPDDEPVTLKTITVASLGRTSLSSAYEKAHLLNEF